jgi:hypothetical protein
VEREGGDHERSCVILELVVEVVAGALEGDTDIK